MIHLVYFAPSHGKTLWGSLHGFSSSIFTLLWLLGSIGPVASSWIFTGLPHSSQDPLQQQALSSRLSGQQAWTLSAVTQAFLPVPSASSFRLRIPAPGLPPILFCFPQSELCFLFKAQFTQWDSFYILSSWSSLCTTETEVSQNNILIFSGCRALS